MVDKKNNVQKIKKMNTRKSPLELIEYFSGEIALSILSNLTQLNRGENVLVLFNFLCYYDYMEAEVRELSSRIVNITEWFSTFGYTVTCTPQQGSKVCIQGPIDKYFEKPNLIFTIKKL